MGAIMRIRNTLCTATHEFFQDNGYFYLQTPIISGSDCEGAGDMFRVTTMDSKDLEGPTSATNGVSHVSSSDR